jgi:hypothetical protein
MSFRVETAPNHYTDYDIFSANGFDKLGQQFLSLINPNYGTTTNKDETTPTETAPIPRNVIQQPSDLCRPQREQFLYYLADQNVLKQIEENFLPHQSILPYTPPSTSTVDSDEQLTISIPDWQTTKQSTESTRYPLSQIITIVQCRSTLTASSFSSASASQRINRHAVRVFINSHHQQQQQMSTFLDIVNEALLLEQGTIKTLWDTKGEQVRRQKLTKFKL